MKNIMLWIGGILFALLLFVMLVGPELPIIDKDLTPVKHRFSDTGKLLMPPYKYSAANPLGSDKKGVDNLSRLVVGTKVTMLVVFMIALLRYIIGIPLGLLAYKKKGIAHTVLNLLNQLFSFLPPIFSVIIVMAIPYLLFADLRLMWVILLMAIVEVGRVGYLVQQEANKLSHEPYVEAGHALGLSNRRLFRKYYISALFPEIIVNFCLDLGKAMALLGQLGVLGIYITHEWKEVNYFTMEFVNTSNDWGSMLASFSREIFVSKFRNVMVPAFAMMFSILTFNILGEGFRRYFNNRWRMPGKKQSSRKQKSGLAKALKL